ncbi:MAG: nucleotidyltransferase domain-containing protein [Oscillospiraceae bacterium]|nr:nucleotidyltransferase domain-containing protein [Oscillospiraceae bacterium]
MPDINEIIKGKEYDFLRTNEHLKGRLIFLTYGGSHAYGTNTPKSDIDIRGVAFNRKSDLVGLSSFEQVVDEATDTTVYSFNKLISLLCSMNPNTIEMVACKEEHYAIYSPVAQQLIDNRRMFLSKRVVNSFGGYAQQQLRRLQNALARDSYPQSEKEKHILESIKSAMMSFEDRYETIPEGSISIYIDDSEQEDLDSEIFVDVNLSHYPLRDYKNIWSDMNNIVKTYGSLTQRNKKKELESLDKHAMHLVRLYLMCLDILEKEEIITYRENDIELLMSIRSGKYRKPDGTYMPEFFEMVDEYGKRMKYAADNTSLPSQPDYKRIEEFVISVNEKVVTDEY